jgi:hypothetical protein
MQRELELGVLVWRGLVRPFGGKHKHLRITERLVGLHDAVLKRRSEAHAAAHKPKLPKNGKWLYKGKNVNGTTL